MHWPEPIHTEEVAVISRKGYGCAYIRYASPVTWHKDNDDRTLLRQSIRNMILFQEGCWYHTIIIAGCFLLGSFYYY